MDGTTSKKVAPIACTLGPLDFVDRLAWIADLTRDGLREYTRRDLTLELRYAPDVVERVRELVRREQACCAFLTFELHEEPGEVRLDITAPEEAGVAVGALFDHFVGARGASSVMLRLIARVAARAARILR